MSRSGDRTSTFDPSHSDNLLHGLNLLWRKQLFCDQPPPPQEEPGTPSSSPDDKLLTSPRAINNLVLQGCSSIGLRLVLEYLYTANVTLSLDTVEEVLSVSKILHIPQVTKLCVQFLNDQISVQNYKQVCKIAALHGLEETKKLANKYLVEDVLLLNFEEMRALLDSLPPPVESELALFQMSVLWLEHDRETRMQYAPDLMKRLRFALIPAPELVERVQSVDFMRTDPVCQKLLLDAMNYHLMPFRQHCRQSLASRIRSNKKMLLLVGGLPPGPDRLPSNLVQYYDDEKKTWKILTIMPYNSAHHCVVEVENFLFVLGGEDQWNPNGFSHLDVMLVECYDPKGDQWNILQTPILEGRSGPGCAVLDDSIYLVGGYSWSMGAYKSSTICYCPEKGTWTELEGDVAEPLAGPACATVILPACVPYNK
ncbi:kelch-like protein 14 [Camelus ferus]|nr:kelch-like protein 14 [Camelus ferus]